MNVVKVDMKSVGVREEDAEETVGWVASPEGSHLKTEEKKDTC